MDAIANATPPDWWPYAALGFAVLTLVIAGLFQRSGAIKAAKILAEKKPDPPPATAPQMITQTQTANPHQEQHTHFGHDEAKTGDILESKLESIHLRFDSLESKIEELRGSLPSASSLAMEASGSVFSVMDSPADNVTGGQPRDPRDDQSILDAAIAAEDAGDRQKAINIYTDAASAGPVDTAIVANLATLHTRAGEYEQAIHLFEQLEQAGRLEEKRHYPFGVALGRLGQFDAALPHLEAALRCEPESTSVQFDLAVTMAATHDQARAEMLLDKVEMQEGQTRRVLLLKAAMSESAQAFSSAFKWYGLAAKELPDVPWLWERYALAAYKVDDLEAANSALQRLRELDPKHGLLQIQPGVLLQLDRKDDAERALQENESVRPLLSLELVGWGQILQLRGDLEGALGRHRQAQALDPKNSTAFLMEAEILQQQGKCPEAIPLFRKHLTEDPLLAGTWSNFGTCLSLLKLHDEAVEAHKTAVRLDEASARHHYNLGCALANAGYNVDALRAVQRAIQLDATFSDHARSDTDLKDIRDDLFGS